MGCRNKLQELSAELKIKRRQVSRDQLRMIATRLSEETKKERIQYGWKLIYHPNRLLKVCENKQ